MDKYESTRNLPFSLVAEALGIDVSRFKVRKQGREYYGPCPVHDSKHNTTCFSYNTDGRWNCFSCQGKGKGAIDLCKAVRKLGFQAAVELLEPYTTKVPSQTEKPPVSGSVSNTAEYTSELDVPVFQHTYRKYSQPSEWLAERIPSQEVLNRYGVFFYRNGSRQSKYSDCVFLPVRKSADGAEVGFLTRPVNPKEGEPKYRMAAGLPKHLFLFGAHEIRAGIFGQPPLKLVYVVESPFCVLKFAMYGLPAVSAYGWSVSEEQIQVLAGLTKGTVYLPDKNKRQECADQVNRLASRLWVRCPELPDGCEDPEHLTRDQLLAL